MASMRKKGKSGYYYARFYDADRSPSRKEVPLRTTRKDVARRRLTRLEEQYETGDYDPWNPDDGKEHLTTREAVGRFLKDKAQTVKESTMKGYRSKLEHWARDYCPAGLTLQDVGDKQIRSYIYEAGLAQSTKAMRYRHLRAFFNWHVKAGNLDASPLDGIDAPREGKKRAAFLRPDDIETLLRAIDAHRELRRDEPGPTPNDRWLKRMIRVAVGTGLRRGELLNLRWNDIDLDGQRLHVRNREDFSTKSGDERVVPLRGDALQTLQAMHEGRSDSLDGPVFTDREGKPLKPDRVTKRFKFYVRKAKLKDRKRISFHNLRHTTGSWLAMQGVPMRMIQQILGHSTAQVTERYSHLSPEALEKAMDETFGE